LYQIERCSHPVWR